MADLQELRGRIIQVFFKHLTSSNEVAVDMSQEGLAAVITYQKMPKTLLQVQSTQQKPVLDHQLVFFPPSQRLWYRVPWQATWICLKLPKLTEALPSFERGHGDALQTSLRPILVNLAYYNKLKLPLLRGLARLLKLLSSWFNVTLGKLHCLVPLCLLLPYTRNLATWTITRSCCWYEL